MGMPTIDYFVGDEVASPSMNYGHFEERLVLMPNTYFVSDYKNSPLNCPKNSYSLKRSEYFQPHASSQSALEGIDDKILLANFSQLNRM